MDWRKWCFCKRLRTNLSNWSVSLCGMPLDLCEVGKKRKLSSAKAANLFLHPNNRVSFAIQIERSWQGRGQSQISLNFALSAGNAKGRKSGSCFSHKPCGVQGNDISNCGWSYTFGRLFERFCFACQLQVLSENQVSLWTQVVQLMEGARFGKEETKCGNSGWMNLKEREKYVFQSFIFHCLLYNVSSVLHNLLDSPGGYSDLNGWRCERAVSKAFSTNRVRAGKFRVKALSFHVFHETVSPGLSWQADQCSNFQKWPKSCCLGNSIFSAVTCNLDFCCHTHLDSLNQTGIETAVSPLFFVQIASV